MIRATIQSQGSFVTLTPISVMGKAAVGVKNSEKIFNEVESRLGSMNGRKFYGLLYGEPDSGEYFACAEVNAQDDPVSLGLEVRQIPGGKYVRRKIRNWSEDLSVIGKGFGFLFDKYPFDHTRPTIEYYRSERDVYILLPVEDVVDKVT